MNRYMMVLFYICVWSRLNSLYKKFMLYCIRAKKFRFVDTDDLGLRNIELSYFCKYQIMAKNENIFCTIICSHQP